MSLRCRRTFLEIVLASVAFLTGCSWFESTPSERGAEITARNAVKQPPLHEVFPKAPDLSDVIRITYQADQIAREAWWVLTKEKRAAGRTPFGKVLRAATLKHDGKLTGKGLFECDRYETEETSLPGGRRRFTFSENCNRREGRKEIAQWVFSGASRAEVEFRSGNLGEVLGLATGIFGKTIRCELQWNERRVLDKLSCPGWEQDRDSHRIRLSAFEYRREGGALLRLKGDVVDGLEVIRKIESEVPLEGKIVVTEIITKAPDIPPALVPVPAEVKAAREGRDLNTPTVTGPPLNQAPPRFQPVDPDLMKRRFMPKEIGPHPEGEMAEEGEEGQEGVEGESPEGQAEGAEGMEENMEENPAAMGQDGLPPEGSGYVAPTGEPDYIPEGDLQSPARREHGQNPGGVRQGSETSPDNAQENNSPIGR